LLELGGVDAPHFVSVHAYVHLFDLSALGRPSFFFSVWHHHYWSSGGDSGVGGGTGGGTGGGVGDSGDSGDSGVCFVNGVF
jgi:hypothetical protein